MRFISKLFIWKWQAKRSQTKANQTIHQREKSCIKLDERRETRDEKPDKISARIYDIRTTPPWMYGSIIHRLNHLHKNDDARWLMTTYNIHCTITVSPADFMSDIHVWILEIWKGFRFAHEYKRICYLVAKGVFRWISNGCIGGNLSNIQLENISYDLNYLQRCLYKNWPLVSMNSMEAGVHILKWLMTQIGR